MYKLAHIGMKVKDCEQSSLFYCKVLGGKKSAEYHNDQKKFIFLDLGGQIIELIQPLDEEEIPRTPGPFDHIAIAVEDINATVARLKELEIKFLSASPQEVFAGQKKIIFFLGPDGERIELVQEVGAV